MANVLRVILARRIVCLSSYLLNTISRKVCRPMICGTFGQCFLIHCQVCETLHSSQYFFTSAQYCIVKFQLEYFFRACAIVHLSFDRIIFSPLAVVHWSVSIAVFFTHAQYCTGQFQSQYFFHAYAIVHCSV
jgi:hypothetical protein